ncbi:alpha/beta hydrolase fold domain-containing protein [Actinosynnema pretiosum]|uniref:Esterase n=1 Tax=Actinosynnema pretiosum TaxID=42197 RepID=A0A290Z8B4_9PSEU|nr:alpha/beta hydrolase fold domain-containing protein [Actinosynnema pretiosum]ATE55203.1 esterase [Actinosynnema pretiosum]
MPTLPLPLARALLHAGYRVMLSRRLPWRAQRALLDVAARAQPLPGGTAVTALELGGRPAERVTVGPTSGRGAVLYLHGGGFTVGSTATHRSLAAHLARAAHRPVHLLDYRLAPEHPCPAAVRDAVAAFDALAGLGRGPVALAGDSAGGGIALAAAQELVARGRGAPAALALLSPWVDPALRAERRRDTVVSRSWGFACGAAYLGGGDPSDPRYAPLRGPMAGLPPTYLFTAPRELLHPQCARLAGELRRAGVPLAYVERADLWHAAQAQAGLVREAEESVRDVAAFLVEHLTAPRPRAGRG